MLHEKDFLGWLRNNQQMKALFGSRIFWKLAPKKTAMPFMVLQDINARGFREIDAACPRMQLDCYSDNEFAVVELAEAVEKELFGKAFVYGTTSFSSMLAERAMVLRMEDGSFKVPVDIKLSCRRDA
nr:DUF3168 domain-containing protein [uncultured Sphaerochaeta sp.]